MPRVPTADTFQASSNALPAARIDAPAMPDVAGRQAQQMGQSMLQLGNGLSRVADDMALQANQDRVDGAMVQLMEHDTRLRVEALQLQGRNALERPDGKPLDEEFGQRLKDAANSISDTLGNDAQRRVFQHQVAQASIRLRSSIASHMVSQSAAVQKEDFRAGLSVAQNRGALLWGDAQSLQQSNEAITSLVDRQAAREGWSPEQRDAALIDAQSPLHVGVLKGMLQGGQAQMAQQYLTEHSASMSIQARAMAQDMLKGQAALDKAQSFADDVMGRGLTLTDALGEARAKLSGDDEAHAVAEIKTRFAEREAGAAQAGREVARTAWSVLMDKGSMSAIPPDTLAALRKNAPEEERQMRDWLEAKWRRAKADAEGKAKTDMDVYYGLRRMAMDDPAGFSALDLRKSQPYLADGDLKHLIELQGSISRGDAKAMESQRVLKQTLGAIRADVAAVGIDLTPKEGTPQAKETALFMGALTQALDQATQAKQAPLSTDEARRIGMGLVQEGIQQGSGVFGMFQTKKRGYQIATDPDIAPGTSFVLKRFADIPEATRNALVGEYRTRGGLGTRPLTADQEAEIEREYTRRVQTGRIK